MQELHASVGSPTCLYAGHHGDLHFTSLQKVIPPDCSLCWHEDGATP